MRTSFFRIISKFKSIAGSFSNDILPNIPRLEHGTNQPEFINCGLQSKIHIKPLNVMPLNSMYEITHNHWEYTLTCGPKKNVG